VDNILNRLESAMINQDAAELEKILDFKNEPLFNNNHTATLCNLLSETWHARHEDIIMTLDVIKDPKSLNALVTSIDLELDYYTGNEIPRKVIWALRSINTPEARAEIEKLTRSEDSFTRKHAFLNLA